MGSKRTSAERQKRFRNRKKRGVRCVMVRADLSETDIDWLVTQGYLAADERADHAALTFALDSWVADSFNPA
jgi:hypothetical protein